MRVFNQQKSTTGQNTSSGDFQAKVGEDPGVLTRMIGHLTATASEDWALVMETCDRASSSESNAKEAIRALRREFKYGEPPAQLSAARLWAIMLRNSSEPFIAQSTSRKFLDTLEDLLQSSRTSPVVRERLLEIVAAAAYASEKGPRENRDGFKGLWRRVKPFDKPDEGVPFDTDDAMFNPPVLGHLSGYEVPMVQYQEATPLPDASNNPPAITAVPAVLTLGTQPQQPPIHTVEKKKSPSEGTDNRITPREDDIRRLFQACNIGQRNASLLSQALPFSKPEDLEKKIVIKEFYVKCRSTQELIYQQIPWASVGAERSRVEANSLRIATGDGNGHAKKRSVSNDDLALADGGETGGLDRELSGDASPTDSDETMEEKLLVALLQANEDLVGALKQYDNLALMAVEREAEERSQRKPLRALPQPRQQLQLEDGNSNSNAVNVEQDVEQQYKDPSASAPSFRLLSALPPNAFLIRPYQPAPLSSSLPYTNEKSHNANYRLHVGPAAMPQRAQPQQHAQQPRQYPQAVPSNPALQRDPFSTDNTILHLPISTGLSDSGVLTVQHREGTSTPHATPPFEPDTDEISPPRYSSIFPDVRGSWHRLAGWRTSIRQQRAKG